MSTPKDLITTTEARKLLGVSTYKIKTLLEDGAIKHYTSLMDKRKKLVSRAEVERLKNVIKEAA
jgi:excisionase family DNA binding protein